MRKVALAFLLVCPNICLGGSFELKKNMSLAEARRVLIKNNWKPVDTHAGDNYVFIGIEKSLKAKGYKELESCAVDRPFCIFNYKRNDECLHLVTFGEQPNALKVYQWTKECPDGVNW